MYIYFIFLFSQLPDSNRRPYDLQSDALPTELSRGHPNIYTYFSLYHFYLLFVIFVTLDLYDDIYQHDIVS